ncbi:MAG: DUF1538 domain-containing protein [Woeseiaceae bacterium]|nr:DUF1538 domain-containing protein [Woeseiaceae bacterium]
MPDALGILWSTALDVLPIVLFIFGFQVFVIRRRLANKGPILAGLVLTILGLGMFLIGLEQALFPLGRLMAEQLTDPSFLGADLASASIHWSDFFWIYVFAMTVGFASTVAEPALLAVSMKANDVSGGAISVIGLRVAVAIGVSVGVALGCFRIVTGMPLYLFIMAGYVVVVLQTVWAPKLIVPLAYDSGGVTTSTVTVPLIAALGLGLSETIPGRSPLLDGFGLVAFAALFPIISVLAYAQASILVDRYFYARRERQPDSRAKVEEEN